MSPSASIINGNSAYDYAWRQLRGYHDSDSLLKHFMSKNEIPKEHVRNAKRQLEQLSFCLTQALEFSNAARLNGPATKALQAYYATTAMANVEILWRGTGEDTIGRRPKRYNRHGLNIQNTNNLTEVAAVPIQNSDGTLDGLFGLWRDRSSHLPHCGQKRIIYQNGATEMSPDAFSEVTALKDIQMPIHPITLVECMQHVPQMQDTIWRVGKRSLVRAVLSIDYILDEFDVTQIRILRTLIHPSETAILDSLLEYYLFSPNLLEDLTAIPLRSGIQFEQRIYRIEYETIDRPSVISPESFSFKQNLSYLVGKGQTLNEFGYFYVGLYILGMISRYHPQLWMKELSRHSTMSLLADQFVDIAITRLPILLLSQLEDNVILYE